MGDIIKECQDGWTAYVAGSGGGGGGKGGGGGGKGKGGGGGGEEPDSLRSRSEAIVVGVLSEGEIQGFEDGADPLKRIFLDGVPIKNNDGSYNFGMSVQNSDGTTSNQQLMFFSGSQTSATGKGSLIPQIGGSIPGLNRGNATGVVNSLVVDYRVGTQNQDPMPGFDDVRVEQPVNIQLRAATGEVVRTTVSDLLSRVRIRIGIGALFKVDKEAGNVTGSSVQFRIRIRPNGGSNFVDDTKVIQGKSRGPVDFEYEYSLQGTGPWIVSVQRLTPDPTSTALSDDLFFRAIVGIYNRSFRYPNTSVIGIKVGAENFSSVPQISADLLGIKVKIPSNYNPWTRTYTGLWDGTFVTNWTNNPAWIFYDLLTNPRYGAGEFITDAQVDRYSLYSIAQYCDGLVSDGKGGLEPRLTFNAYITDQGGAYEVLNSLAAVFRGLLYFLEGTVVATQDKPKQTTKIFGPANVIQNVDESGRVTEPPFTYEGTARKARTTVALVSWNDPQDMYRERIEYVEDRAGLERYGYRPLQIRAFGTTSQGQAQRIGRWTLLSNQLETEIVTFKLAAEGFFLLPGEIIGIADPTKGGKRFGGRITGATSTSITIDAPFDISGSATYSLSLNCAGDIVTRPLTNGPGSTSILTFATPLDVLPTAGSPWVLQEDNTGIRRFRVTAVQEDGGIVTVLGTLYDESKFDQTDNSTIVGVSRTPVVGPRMLPTVNGNSIVMEIQN